MKKVNPFIALLFFFGVMGLKAQEVTLKIPDMVVQPGTVAHVAVQVENFTDVTGIQFSLNWNKDVLQFVGVDNFGLPGVTTEGNFGPAEESEGGKLRFSWYQQELTGVDLADMSTIFSIWFNVVGTLNSSSQVMITDDPIIIEVVGLDGFLPFKVDNGVITVQDPNASKETRTSDFTLFQNNPNPFTETTYISFSLPRSVQAELSIFEPSGKVIFRENRNFAAGITRIPVSRDIFSSAGTYFYTLKTERATATRQLLAQ